LFGEADGVAGGAHHDEGVVARAGHGVRRLHRRLDPGRHPGEHAVTRRRAERGVHETEAVEVEVDDGDRTTPGPPERLIESVEKEGPVGQARHGVVGGRVGDVLHAEQGAAAGDGGPPHAVPTVAAGPQRQLDPARRHLAAQDCFHRVADSHHDRREVGGRTEARDDIVAYHRSEERVLAPCPVHGDDAAGVVEHGDPKRHGVEQGVGREVTVTRHGRGRSPRSRARPA
jgi:hypothetical protein